MGVAPWANCAIPTLVGYTDDELAVIDWEFSRPGPPLADLIYFVTFWTFTVRNLRGDQAQLGAFRQLFLTPERPDPQHAILRHAASNGFVRSRLTVVRGGAGPKSSAVASAVLASGAAMVAVETHTHGVEAEAAVIAQLDARLENIRAARLKGYEGDSCGECGNFTLVRNGTCLKCDTCGGTSGCSLTGVFERTDASRLQN